MAEDNLATRGADLVEEYGSLAEFFQKVGIGGVSYALILQVVAMIDSAGSVLLAPWKALGSGLATLTEGTIGGGVEVIDASLQTVVVSFETGLASMFGPAAFPLGVISVMSGVYVFIWFVSRIGFSPLAFISDRG